MLKTAVKQTLGPLWLPERRIQFPSPPAGCVGYWPGYPPVGNILRDFSNAFVDVAIDTDEELDDTETDITCSADATTAIPVGSIIRIENEQCLVTATGLTLMVDRHVNGTAPATHATGQDIYRKTTNHGTIEGATWERLPSGLWGLSFGGAADYVNCGDNSIFNFTSELFSVETWLKLHASYTAAGALVFRGGHGADGWFLGAGWPGGSILSFYTNQAGVGQNTDTGNISLNTWYHCVAVRTSTANVNIYLNGVDATLSHGTHLDPATSAQNLVLGMRSDLVSNPLYGFLALTRVYNMALTTTEIANHYQRERYLWGV